MTIQTTINDRKELARMLIPFNHNEKLHYAGTPTFAFEGHGFRILRNGDIECEDEKTEAAITTFLQNEGSANAGNSTRIGIRIHYSGCTRDEPI